MNLTKSIWPPAGAPIEGLVVPARPGGVPRGYALLLHGLTGTPREMLPLAERLAAEDFECSIPLFPGHGSSLDALCCTPSSEWTAAAEAALRAITAKNDSAPVVVLGLSFGAILTLWLMEQHPTEFSHAALLSPPLALRSLRDEVLLRILRSLPEPLLPLLGSRSKKARREGYLSYPHFAYPRHSLAATTRLMSLRAPLLRTPPPWNKPILLALDPQDHLIDTQRAVSWYRENYPHGEVLELEGGEHELTLGHRSAELASRVVKWLSTKG